MLGEGVGPRHVDDLARYRDNALAECDDDPGLRATVLAKQAANAAGSTVSKLVQAEAWAREALASARGADPDAERLAHYGLAWALAMTGRPVDEQCEAYWAASDAPSYGAGSPERVAAQRLLWRGETARARSALTALLAVADERGERESYALIRLHMCELHLRSGELDAAALLLEEWSESSDRELMFRPKYERCCALLVSATSGPAEAEPLARLAIARAEETGSRWDGLEGLRALALVALLDHDPASAVTALREVWQHTQAEGVSEPGVFPVAPELVEALAEVGELAEAREVTVRLRELAEDQAHPWALASAARCEALLALAGDRYDQPAAARMGSAASSYEALGLHFDAARTLLSLGRAARRFKQWGLARGSLERAAATFEAIGSPVWAEQAHSELARVGARRPRPAGELTATELRTAQLAATGLSNKEIARQLVVTVHTVELHLSRSYAKLGIRSRGQLAQRLGSAAVND
jgi:DNA-binding CsgD family transcriptional regulator